MRRTFIGGFVAALPMILSSLTSTAVQAETAAHWSTAYCYSEGANPQGIIYLGDASADSTAGAGKRPAILISIIPANQNSFNITGEAQPGYYEANWKTNLTREKTVLDMSAMYTGANQPNTGVFMEVSLPVLATAPQPVTTVAGTLTIRMGEDELGFEGTGIGTMPIRCDLR